MHFIIGVLFQLSVLTAPKLVNAPFPAKDYRDTTQSYIVIHYDSSFNATSTLHWLRRKRDSYHYFILTNGIVEKLVDPAKEAGHAGRSFWDGKWHMNKYSIGICLQNMPPNDFTDNQYQSVAWLVHRLELRFPDILHHEIIGHSDIAWPRGRKKDPGDRFEWATFKHYLAIARESSDSSFISTVVKIHTLNSRKQ